MNLENLLKKIKKGKKFIRNALIAGLISSGLFLTSCPSPPPPPPSPDKENELSENTQVLPEQDILKITALYDNEITLSEPISYLSSGDIIVGDISDVTPNGFLRKVEYISRDGRTLYTEPASLEEALKNADFEFQGTLYPTNVYSLEAKSGVSEKLLTPQSLLEFNINLDNVILYDSDGNESTTYDQVRARGDISFNSSFVLDFEINDFHLEKLIFENITSQASTFEITTDFSHTENFYREKELKEYIFPSFLAGYIPGTIFPIIITPKLEVYVGASGKILPEMATIQRANLTAGLVYERGIGWNLISGSLGAWDCFPRTLKDVFDFKIFAGPRLNLIVNGIGGPYGELNAYVKFIDPVGSPWELRVGSEMNLGVKMEIFSKTIADSGKINVLDYYEVLAQGEEIPEPPTLEKILFASFLDSDELEVYSMNEDGSVLRRLTNNSFLDNYPRWSSDMTKIAFMSKRDGNEEIYTMNADGSNQTRLTYNAILNYDWDREPSWSPYGTEIAFTSTRDRIGGPGKLYLMNADGSNQRKLISNNSYSEVRPSWSPYGTQIVFQGGILGKWGSNIYKVNKDGTGLTNLTNIPYLDNIDNSHELVGYPSWSPDGNSIAFSSTRDGNWEIYVMNTNGSNLQRLTYSSSQAETWPIWSKDSSKIFFESSGAIFSMNADGSNVKRIPINAYSYIGND